MDLQKWIQTAKNGKTGTLKHYAKQYSGQRDDKGWTALMHAASVNNIDNIQFLIDKELGIHSPSNYTALMIAVERNFDKAVQYLTSQAGTRINSGDPVYKQGTTALAIAMQCQNMQLVRYLLNYEEQAAGLTKMHIDAFYHKTTDILQACKSIQQQQIDTLKRLPITYMTFITPTPENEVHYKQALRKLAELPETFHTHKKDVYGLTPLHYAVIYNNKPAIEALTPIYQNNGIFIPQTISVSDQRQSIYFGKDQQYNTAINLKELAGMFRVSPLPSSEQTQNISTNEQVVLRNSQANLQHNNISQGGSPSPINFNLAQSLRESKLSRSNNQDTQQNIGIDQLSISQHNDLMMNSLHNSRNSYSMMDQVQQQNQINQNDQLIKSRLSMIEQGQKISPSQIDNMTTSMVQKLQKSQIHLEQSMTQLTRSKVLQKSSQAMDDLGGIAVNSTIDLGQSKVAGAEVTPSFSGVQQNVGNSQVIEMNELSESKLKQNLRLLRSEFKFLEQDNNELQVRHQTALERIETQEKLIQNLKNQIFELEGDMYSQSLQDDKIKLKIQAQRTAMYDLEAQIFRLQNQQDQATDFVVQLQKELELKTLECDNLRQMHKETEYKSKQLQVEKSIYADKLETLQSQLQGVQGERDRASGMALENTQLYAKVVELQNMNDKLTDELTAQKEENQALEQELQRSRVMLASQRLVQEIDQEVGEELVPASPAAGRSMGPGDRSLGLSQLGGRQVCGSGSQRCGSQVTAIEAPRASQFRGENWAERVQSLENELEMKNQSYQELQSRYEQLQELYNELQEEVERLETSLEQKRIIIQRLESEVQNTVSEMDYQILESHNDALRADNRELSLNIDSLEAKNLELEERKEMVIKEYILTKQKLLKLQAELAKAAGGNELAETHGDAGETGITEGESLVGDATVTAGESDEDKDATIARLRERLAAAERSVRRMREAFKAWMVDIVQ